MRSRHDARRVAVDVADDQVQLRHDTTQLPPIGHPVPFKRLAIADPSSAGERTVVMPGRLQRLELGGCRTLAAGHDGAGMAMRLPGGAATPAMYATTGLLTCSRM